MARRTSGRPGSDDETRIRRALSGAAVPLGLRERILAAIDAIDAREAAERRRVTRGRSPRRSIARRPRRSRG